MAPPSQHRRLQQYGQGPIPRLAPGQAHDSRGYPPGYQGNVQQDIIDLENMRRGLAADGVVSFADLINDLDARNLPPQLKQATFLAVIPAFGVPGAVKLIPQNPVRRFSFVVSNFLGKNLVLFSYGKPVDTGAGVGAGLPIGNYYQEQNGAISIDDIWVFCNDPNESYPFTMLGYEGGISVAGNKR